MNPNVFHITNDKDFTKSLKQASETLDKIQDGLKDYIAEKRTLFPRFYFMLDDEILYCLGLPTADEANALQRNIGIYLTNLIYIYIYIINNIISIFIEF